VAFLSIEEDLFGAEVRRAQALREELHRYPELSRQEMGTAERLAAFLRDLPVTIRRGVAGTGIQVDLDSASPSALPERIAFRADMDALPVSETTDLPFASATSGVMHACGHDCHMAILAGVIRLLCAHRERLPRNYRFLFQPAEEDNPEGGAAEMIREGVLEGVRAAFGAHVWPDLATGTVGLRPGPLMAASDRVRVCIEGKSAHAAKPHQGVDAALVAAHILVALQAVASRFTDPVDACALTFGHLCAGTRYNVVAETALLEGTCRTLSPRTRRRTEAHITCLSKKIAEGFGARCRVAVERGYPVLRNDPRLFEAVLRLLKVSQPKVHILIPSAPELVAEDFSRIAERVPSLFLWIGCRPTDKNAATFPRLHTPNFCPDAASIEVGMRCFLAIALAEKL